MKMTALYCFLALFSCAGSSEVQEAKISYPLTPQVERKSDFLQLTHSVYKVENGSTVGSCVGWKKGRVDDKRRIYFLSAWHNTKGMGPEGLQISVNKELNNFPKNVLFTKVDIVAERRDMDLIVFGVYTDLHLPLADISFRQPVRGDSIMSVGFPIGIPMFTFGHVQCKYEGKNLRMMSSTPISFGNSGGGVFNLTTSKLIGISQALVVYDFYGHPAPIAHMHIFKPLSHAKVWLTALKL